MNVPACLSALLKVAQSFDRDVTVISDAQGWKVNCMDPAHFSMATMEVPASAFTDYAEWGTFGLRIADIADLIPKAESMELDDGRFVLKGGKWRKTVRTIMPESIRMAPSPQLSASAMVDIDMLKPAVTAFDPKDIPEVRFTMTPDGLTVIAGDDSKAKMEVEIPADDTLSLECTDTVSAQYSTDYWQGFLKTLPKGSVVELSMDTDYPVVVGFGVGDMSGRWVLAPRISESE